MGKLDSDEEDLAIQDTLAMTPEERIELLAALIVDKISEDLKNDRTAHLNASGAEYV